MGLPKSRRWLSGGAALLAFLGCAVGAELRVVGSDLLGLDFTQAVYQFSGQQRLGLALALEGSRPGLAELKAGRADLGIIVLPAGEVGQLGGYRTLPLGYLGVAVVVPASCPLDQISLPQLARAFGPEAARSSGSAAFRWRDLGVGGEWGEANVVTVVPEIGGGLVDELFRDLVLRGQALRPGVRRFASATELAAFFGADSRAVALVAAGTARPSS